MRFRKWMYLLYPLTLPMVLVSLLLMLRYRVMGVRFRDGCLEVSCGKIYGDPAGQCLGCPVIFYMYDYWDMPSIRVHERVHVVQGLTHGPLFPVAYLGHFLYNYIKIKVSGSRTHLDTWMEAYYEVWAERQAYRIQHEYNQGKRPNAWGGE